MNNERDIIYRLTESDLNRIFDFLNNYFSLPDTFDINFIEYYIGGSQSKYSAKFPNSNSDIDIYIFCDLFDIERRNKSDVFYEFESLSNKLYRCLGYKNQIFLIDKYYMNEAVVGMQQVKIK